MTQVRGSHPSKDARSNSGERSLRELVESFPAQWILMSVTACNERDEPVSGHVLFRNKSRKQLSCFMEQMDPATLETQRVLIFFSDFASLPASARE